MSFSRKGEREGFTSNCLGHGFCCITAHEAFAERDVQTENLTEEEISFAKHDRKIGEIGL